MNIEEFREHCLSIKGAAESLPFLGHNVLVMKIMGKMFAFIPLEPRDGRFVANLKCDPEKSIELRERYNGIGPGHHPSTLLWNGIDIDSDVPDALIVSLIRHSADEVLKKLSAAKRAEYFAAHGGNP